jgi:transposase InsO family protein
VIDGIRVSRSRVLRIMRENSLLSPHRRPARPAGDHDGSITTEAPNVMWGADGALIPTVEDGNVTLFIVAEHWNGEGLGWHVAKHGNRYAAAEALAVAVNSVFGSVRPDAARGLSLRHDHGSAFMSGYFQKQLKVFGMAPSFAFVREPETNGVAERFIRTLKEQIVFGRIYQDIEEVRAAVRAYVERYNQRWLLEKNGYRSPAETRRNWMAKTTRTHEAA